MSVIVDTPVWSLAFRRRGVDLSALETATVAELAKLVRERRAALLGPIRQELLSGLRDAAVFDRLRLLLRPIPDAPLGVEDLEEAARCANRCRASGVAGSPVDFLICGCALRISAAIFTLDRDFSRYARVLDLRLHTAG
ncbi:MAG: PIN domain-containing protein [Phycisphaerae bacterium]